MPTILITGGTGLVGTALSKELLKRNFKVIIFTRSIPMQSPATGLEYARWNVEKGEIDLNAIQKADYIVHLAGAGVADKRWTTERKKEIVESRVASSKLLVDSLQKHPNKVKAVVSASAIGWYQADMKDQRASDWEGFVETDPPGNDFLGITCQQWEQSIAPITVLGKRLVILRTGIVLSKDGGALKEFLKPIKWGVAAILGEGKQMISWILIDDLVAIYIKAIEDENMHSVFNAVAPTPVTNKDLTIALARSKRKYFIPIYVPSFLLRLLLGEMSVEVLKSSKVSSRKVEQYGFDFFAKDIKKVVDGF